MARIYEIRMKASPGVTAEQLLTALSSWINASPTNALSNIDLNGYNFPIDRGCPDAQLSAVRAEIDETVFTAVRLQEFRPLSPPLPNDSTLNYSTEFLLEEGANGCFLTLRLDRSLSEPNKAAALPSLSIPSVLRELSEQGLLAPDGGLPLRMQPLPVTPQLDKTLQQLRLGTVFSARPLLLVREGNFALTPNLAVRLCQFVHVLLLPAIHPALLGLGAGSAQLLFPRLKWTRAVDLTRPTAIEDITDWACRLTSMAVPGDLPTFDRLQATGTQEREPASAFLCVNRKFADSVRFYRIKNGLTQAELAQKAGTTGLMISRLENNRPARVQGSLVTALEEALHLTGRELFACEGISDQQEPQIIRPAFCPNCGTKTGEQGAFCPACGNKLV